MIIDQYVNQNNYNPNNPNYNPINPSYNHNYPNNNVNPYYNPNNNYIRPGWPGQNTLGCAASPCQNGAVCSIYNYTDIRIICTILLFNCGIKHFAY